MGLSICDVFNPIKIVGFICSIFVLIIVFTVGGYVGKYWIENPDLEVNVRLGQSDFWIPDGNFWGSGLVTIIIIIFIFCAWETLKMILEKILNFVFCTIPCFICCCSPTPKGEKIQAQNYEKFPNTYEEDV